MIFWAMTWSGIGHGTLVALIWSLTAVLLLVGLAGTVLPMLPGPALIFAAAVIHYLAMHFLASADAGIGWPGFLVLLLMLIVAHVLEMFSSAVGAKYFGSTRWGIWGAIIGGIVGLFFGLPGIFIGPIVGALLFEIAFARREWKPAAKSTWGTLVGTTAGLVLKVGIGVIMIGYFLLDVLWLHW
jgi:uncharacterized protein